MALLACAGVSSPVDTGPEIAPRIESLGFTCDRESDQLLLDLRIQGWTSGATWWIHDPESQRTESHALLSQRADSGGEWEELAAELASTPDPRQQQDGTSTTFVCGEVDRLAFRLGLEATRGEEEVDCRIWGESADWMALLGAPDCDLAVLE